MIKGILFDIDGTLVLSNDAHAAAWIEAFKSFGYDIPFETVRRLIGMGGDKLLEAVQLDVPVADGDAPKIADLRSEIFMKKYAETLHPTPGARDLVLAVQQARIATMVASSAKQSELEALLKMAGVFDVLTEATTADEVENSKPDPDIVHTALHKIGLPAAAVVMIGDTPYDIAAAARAAVRCIAVRSGGWDDAGLAGAAAIYDNPRDLLDHRAAWGF